MKDRVTIGIAGFSIFDIYDEMNGAEVQIEIDIKVVSRNPGVSTIFLRLRENCGRPRFVYFKNIPQYYRKI